ncbi:MAG: T9SS type A sorting domain-containing protein [Bacteroidetes bacterium]|nr:T9SS type A sorting domain-containing protein [Bacteroidota bacterium]
MIPTEGYMGFYQQCGFGPNTPSGPELFAFATGLEDRGWFFNNPSSPVSHITEGIAGSRIFKVEWNNAGIQGPNNWLDFQVWLYEGTNIAEIRYGASFVSDTTNAWTFNPDGPMVLFAYDVLCNPLMGLEGVLVYGYRNNPQYIILDTTTALPPVVVITSVPDSGMVYRFAPWAISVQENLQHELFKLYPNPASGHFYIQGSFALPAVIELYDMMGRKVYRQQVTSNKQQINVTQLAGGLYVYRLVSGGKIARGKVVVE